MNSKLLVVALELLESVQPGEIESVQIENTKYDDGTVGFTINVMYPAKEADSTKRDDAMCPYCGGGLCVEVTGRDGKGVERKIYCPRCNGEE